MATGTSTVTGTPRYMVVALGTDTSHRGGRHWELVVSSFPAILNCCIDVKRSFRREDDESTEGSGFDSPTRDRMKAKDTWVVVLEAAKCVLRAFGIVVVLCNHGKHRSLSVAYELAAVTGGELVNIRDRRCPNWIRDLHDVMATLAPRLTEHVRLFGSRPHPVAGIHVCRGEFDGPEWVAVNDPFYGRLHKYHHMRGSDVVIETTIPRGVAHAGWRFGTLIGRDGIESEGWYHPGNVRPMGQWHFREVRDLHSSLMVG